MSGSAVVAGTSPALAAAKVGSQGARVLAVDRLAGGMAGGLGQSVWAQHSIMGLGQGPGLC